MKWRQMTMMLTGGERNRRLTHEAPFGWTSLKGGESDATRARQEGRDVRRVNVAGSTWFRSR